MLFSTDDGVTAHAVITSSGYVGIGTSNPSVKTHIYQSIAGNELVRIEQGFSSRDAQVNLIELSHTAQKVISELNDELAYQDIEIAIQSNTAEEMESNIDLIIKLAMIEGC